MSSFFLWIDSIRGPDFEAKKISIFFVFAKLFVFFDESPMWAPEGIFKKFEDFKITGVIP